MKLILNENFGTHNTSVRNGKIEYIVIHYVGATGSAKNNIDYFNRPSTDGSSADFFVDFNGDVYQYNMELEKRYCWSVGGKKQSSHDGAFYGKCTNANSVSIELCCRKDSQGFYFEDATVEGAIELTKMLMSDYNIDADHVIRHADVNGKRCPDVTGWLGTNGGTAKWEAFKEALTDAPYEEDEDDSPAEDEPKPEYHYTEPGQRPNKVVLWEGEVDVESWDRLNVRVWAGVSYPVFERLPKGAKVGVCDRRYANDGAAWYYIRMTDGRYGFVNASYIK